MEFERLQAVLRALEAEGVRYAIFGDIALNLHGIARFTEDIDIFVEPAADNVTALKRALRRVFDDPDIETISAADLLGDYPAIQYIPPAGGFRIDIVTRLGEAFAFADLDVTRAAFGDVEVSVVTRETLYRMKRDTVRLKDRADAEALRRRFGLEG